MPVVITPRRYAPSRPALPPPRSPRPKPPAPPAPGLIDRWKTAWLLECARFVPIVVLAPKPRVRHRL